MARRGEKRGKKETPGQRRVKRSFKTTFLRILVFILLLFVMVSLSGVVTYRFINPPFTFLMVDRAFHKLEKKGETIVIRKQWVPSGKIPQAVFDAVIASEDNKFPVHHGFDFGEMREAHKQNKEGKRLRGASTITQQMCKNVFLWEGRSYFRKILEAWYTVWVEIFWNKRRIMEVYLNVIEMGDGIYGIGAASQYYYNKPAEQLSREEAAMIASILPSPRKRNIRKPTPYMVRRQQQILDLMDKIGEVKL